jgi:NAD(P)-dependent dehydrogenase (short-subunit alcohol dehydrogenase family)
LASLGLKLEGKVALITGAGSGVGKAMAELFSDSGCKVVVVDVFSERVSQVVEKIGSKNAIGLIKDLSTKNQVESMIDEAYDLMGKIDILCNNAGIMDGVAPVTDTSDELWQRVLNVNLNAPFWACRRALPRMLKESHGTILNTASVASFFAGKAGAAYTVSKHGLVGLTKSIAVFYGDKGIRCNAMILGAVNTAIGLGSTTPSLHGLELMKKATATLPRVADPVEIAKLGLFLVSDDSSYVNGSCVVIDDGWTAI